MPLRQTLADHWTRRAVLRASAGLAAGVAATRIFAGIGRLEAAETSVPATNSCIDMPIKTGVHPLEREAIENESIAAAALDQLSATKGAAASPTAAAASFRSSLIGSAAAKMSGISDRLITHAAQLAPHEPGRDATVPAQAAFLNKWPINELSVFFITSQFGASITDRLAGIVMERVEEWSKVCKMKFRRTRNPADSQIRVNFLPRQGHSSFVGRQNLDPQLRNRHTMNLDMNLSTINKAYEQGVILHEFGHAIGMLHEHQSPTSTLRFGSMARLLAHFGPLGLNTEKLIRDNILTRYGRGIERFSEFDPLSIMTYSIPDSVMAPGSRGIHHNLELSALDKKFANEVYPLDIIPPQPTPPKKLEIIVGSEAVEGALEAGGSVEVKLTVPSILDRKSINILTTGTTVLLLSLADSTGHDLTPADVPAHGTPDYVNEVINTSLPAGEYKLKIVHISVHGGGSFKVAAKPGNFAAPLVSPNRKL